MEQLYKTVSAVVRSTLRGAVPPEAIDDSIHEVMIMVLEAIQAGALRDRARVNGFIKTIAQRHAIAQIRSSICFRRYFTAHGNVERCASRDGSPETPLDRRDRLNRARKILRVLNSRDREILERFYLQEQPREQICGEMQLTVTQFRLFKSRAIARCLVLGGASQPVHSESRIA